MPSYRPWGSTEDGTIEFESLTDETLEGALRVIRESFFVHESVCKGVDLLSEAGAAEELEELCLNAAKDGVSVVAIDVTNGEVVGVSFNKIQVQGSPSEKNYFESFSERCKHESSKALVDFMNEADALVNLFRHYNVDCILEIMFLATLQSHGKRRIGELLVSSSLEIGNELKRGKPVKIPVAINDEDADFIRNRDATPALVSAIMTSRFSQKIAAKLGLERLVEVPYDRHEYAGKKFSERIGKQHPGYVLVAKRLTS